MADRHDQQPASPKRNGGRQLEQWYRLAGIGLEFIVAILLLGAVGWWLDSRWGTRPWLMLAGGGLGFALGLWILLKAAMGSFHD